MRLENFLALTQTKLINEPCINSFENVVFEAAKVKRGDLFFAYEQEEIDPAVANGAYAVVFEGDAKASDYEIAWIKADSLDGALKRLLRFIAIDKEIVAYECNEVVLKLSLQVTTADNFIPLLGDVKSIYKSLVNAQNRSTVLFCPALLDKNIFVNPKKIPSVPHDAIEIIEQTLFETSFIYDDIFYERQLISPFFMTYLEELMYFFKTLKIGYKLKKFTPMEHFEAVFTNKKFEVKNFGASDKVLIFEPNVSLVKTQILFLERHATWAKTIFVLPCDISEKEKKENVFCYRTKSEIINILKRNDFHFALIGGADKSILDRPLLRQMQMTMEF